MKSNWLALLAVLFAVEAGVYYVVQPVFHHAAVSSVIRVGVLPDEDIETLRRRYGPLLDHLSAETGLECKLVLPRDYGELVRLFLDHEVDLAHFGGLTFVQAYVAGHAEPLVMRDVDTRVTSLFLVKGGDPARGLLDFKGRSFSFGSPQSTSGHLMPRHFIQTKERLIPERFFSELRYAGAHDKTAYLVRDGVVDLGVANSEIVRAMLRDGRLKQYDLRVLWETPPFPGRVWAVHDHLDEGLKTRLRDAFLGLDAGDAVHAGILSSIGADTFLPAGIREFMPLMEIAGALGLLRTETP